MPDPVSPSAAPAPPVRVEIADGVATLTLDDAGNRNALSSIVIEALLSALSEAAADASTRVVVITNSGSVFCAGADLREQSTPEGRARPNRFPELLTAIQSSPKPVVGRIDGHAVAGGVGLAAACDISIARDDVLLGFTEVRVGVIPAVISVVCLPKMRRADAMETFLRGTRFPATKAAEIGLINRAVPAGELDAAVDEVLADLKLGGPDALRGAKQLVDLVPTMTVPDALAAMATLSAQHFASAEAAEGMAAFREKRRPSWAGDA